MSQLTVTWCQELSHPESICILPESICLKQGQSVEQPLPKFLPEKYWWNNYMRKTLYIFQTVLYQRILKFKWSQDVEPKENLLMTIGESRKITIEWIKFA